MPLASELLFVGDRDGDGYGDLAASTTGEDGLAIHVFSGGPLLPQAPVVNVSVGSAYVSLEWVGGGVDLGSDGRDDFVRARARVRRRSESIARTAGRYRSADPPRLFSISPISGPRNFSEARWPVATMTRTACSTLTVRGRARRSATARRGSRRRGSRIARSSRTRSPDRRLVLGGETARSRGQITSARRSVDPLVQKFTQADGFSPTFRQVHSAGHAPAFASPSWHSIWVHTDPAGSGAQIGAATAAITVRLRVRARLTELGVDWSRAAGAAAGSPAAPAAALELPRLLELPPECVRGVAKRVSLHLIRIAGIFVLAGETGEGQRGAVRERRSSGIDESRPNLQGAKELAAADLGDDLDVAGDVARADVAHRAGVRGDGAQHRARRGDALRWASAAADSAILPVARARSGSRPSTTRSNSMRSGVFVRQIEGTASTSFCQRVFVVWKMGRRSFAP